MAVWKLFPKIPWGVLTVHVTGRRGGSDAASYCELKKYTRLHKKMEDLNTSIPAGTKRRSQVTGYRSQVTGHRAQVTGHRSQVTENSIKKVTLH